jgi:glycosyltransferase involved in cell wall biosynthesis
MTDDGRPANAVGATTDDTLRITVIFTVLNEEVALPRLLDSLAAQTRLPDEVVVCDGGSRDGTLALLRAERRFPLRVIESPGVNISRGRNLAIAAATHDIIACTDAGVRLDPCWLENLTRLWIDDLRLTIDSASNRQSSINNRKWVGGFFLPDPHSTFEIAMGATVLPALGDIRPDKFLPSSRSVAFRKSAWARAGGYPEWLDYCEDLIFDFKLREAFGPCAFAPDALVYFRPRSSLRAFFKQYYLYARGDGKANLWLKRHIARYGTYLVALPALSGGMFALPGLPALLCAALLLLGGAAYMRAPYRRLVSVWGRLTTAQKAQAALFVPAIRVAGDIAKMIGYPVGVWWRLSTINRQDH